MSTLHLCLFVSQLAANIGTYNNVLMALNRAEACVLQLVDISQYAEFCIWYIPAQKSMHIDVYQQSVSLSPFGETRLGTLWPPECE